MAAQQQAAEAGSAQTRAAAERRAAEERAALRREASEQLTAVLARFDTTSGADTASPPTRRGRAKPAAE